MIKKYETRQEFEQGKGHRLFTFEELRRMRYHIKKGEIGEYVEIRNQRGTFSPLILFALSQCENM